MATIPTPEEIGSGHYFLQMINNPVDLIIIRCVLAAIAITFDISYIYIRMKKDKEKYICCFQVLYFYFIFFQ